MRFSGSVAETGVPVISPRGSGRLTCAEFLMDSSKFSQNLAEFPRNSDVQNSIYPIARQSDLSILAQPAAEPAGQPAGEPAAERAAQPWSRWVNEEANDLRGGGPSYGAPPSYGQ